MTSLEKPSLLLPVAATLIEQRRTLRLRLLAQRQLIALQLGATTRGHSSSYPRSATMRLLSGRPALVAKLLTPLATILLGARLFGSVTMMLAVLRMARSASANGRNR